MIRSNPARAGVKETLFARLRQSDLVALRFKAFSQGLAHFGFVFHNQDLHRNLPPL